MPKGYKTEIEDPSKGAIPVDMNEWERKRKEARAEVTRKYEEAVAAEKIRFDNIECPVCKSRDKTKESQSDSNGIMGPGFRSRTTFECLICLECGVMYKDLKKPNIVAPDYRYL